MGSLESSKERVNVDVEKPEPAMKMLRATCQSCMEHQMIPVDLDLPLMEICMMLNGWHCNGCIRKRPI